MSQISSPGEAMSLRDHFAAAALTGLLASGMDSVDEMPTRAYRMADAMLRERDRPGRDDSVSQNTAETMRPVTEPMPKEKRAEVSEGWRRHIRPPDAADRAIAAACDKAWGVTAEPVAWGLPNADGDEIWATSLNKEAIERHCPTNQTLVPLYRQPQPTLTDAEREAVLDAALAYEGDPDEWECAKIAATLRGLLERMK